MAFFKRFFFILACLVLLNPLFARRWTVPRPQEPNYQAVDAPFIEGWDISGQDYIQLSNYQDKLIIAHFWATWAPASEDQIPNLIELQENYHDELQVIGLSYDYNQNKALGAIKEYEISYPVLLGSEETRSNFGGVSSFPTTYVINRQQEVVATLVGYRDYEQLKTEILPLIRNDNEGFE